MRATWRSISQQRGGTNETVTASIRSGLVVSLAALPHAMMRQVKTQNPSWGGMKEGFLYS
jgi:hypothetical protein